jgi:hypothetical protein
MIDVTKPLFKLGSLVATPGAAEALEQAGQAPWEFLARHVQGDFGEVDGEDRRANEQAVETGGRILSVYRLRTGVKVWVITEADRSASCVLLPEDY